jgi:hypothetical protein
MAKRLDERDVFLLMATAAEPVATEVQARSRFLAALEQERYLPFCRELARHFDLDESRMHALLARIDDPEAWTRGIDPIQGFLDFTPGPALLPLRGGFVRMRGGMLVRRHRHLDRELTVVLEGELVDDNARSYGPGSAIDMPAGSSHALAVPEGKDALVALLHGHIEMLS